MDNAYLSVWPKVRTSKYKISVERSMLDYRTTLSITAGERDWQNAQAQARLRVPDLFEDGAAPTLESAIVLLACLQKELNR